MSSLILSSLLLTAATATAAALALFGVPQLRRRLVTGPLLRRFRRVMPAMSVTEREALEAGGVWWDAELFSGQPRWQRLLELPAARLTDAEQAFLNGPVEELCRELDDWQITHERLDLSPQAWSLMRRHRFFGLVIPNQYGGLGFSPLAHSQVVMKLASRSLTGAVTVMVPSSLGPAELLLRYGTEQQRAHYLPRLARGDEIPCFALTGPRSGSDAASMPDQGVVCHGELNGRKTLGIRLDFDKRYITLAPVATLIGVAFRLRDPDGLLGADPEPGITLALIPASTPGIQRGKRHFPLGIPFQNGPLSAHGLFIPIDWVIGGPAGVGKGWRMLMETLAEGRGISLPALATGAGKLACRFTGAYARVRRQFGRPIGSFEGVEEPLARIAGRTYQMDAARRVFLSALAAGERPAVLSAILKYHLTEIHRQVVNDAMDVLGGRGICLGPENPIGRVHQSIPIAITVEGANILTRSLIIFGQGALRCHPFLLAETRAAHESDPRLALRRFDAAVIGHVGHLARTLLRTIWHGITRSRGAQAPADGDLGLFYRRLNWLASAFALNADLILMTLAGSLKRRERISARLGDLLSLLFLASAVLRHFEDQGRPASSLPLLQWSLADLLHRADEAFRNLWRNLPNRRLAWLLRTLSFPTGSPFHGPDDALDRAVAQVLLSPNAARDALTDGIFLDPGSEFPIGRMDRALEGAVEAEPAEALLRTAVKRGELASVQALDQAVRAGILPAEQAAAVRRADALRNRVIQVDAFDQLVGGRTVAADQRSAA